MKVSRKFLKNVKFTFHYGSILMSFPASRSGSMYLFTFHYGSILIKIYFLKLLHYTRFTFHYGSILISTSIPTKDFIDKFTFHYGSILITNNILNDSLDMIYIPLWFYSNIANCTPLLVIRDLHSTMVLF